MGIRENQKKGLQGEKDWFTIESALNPHVKRTGRGSDFQAGLFHVSRGVFTHKTFTFS